MVFLSGMFPSPYGDYGSYLPENDDIVYEAEALSFRPLTGIMVLICFALRAIHLYQDQFPSPYGDYGSYRGPHRWERPHL